MQAPRYLITIHPLVLGSGRRLFPEGGPGASLHLVDSRTTTTGVVVSHISRGVIQRDWCSSDSFQQPQMVSAGLVGGLGPESTIDYYRRILLAWHQVEPSTAPSVVIDSLDVRHLLALVEHDRPALIQYLLASLQRLAGAGVGFAAIAANTPHVVFDALAAVSPIPLVSIVEVCARHARQLGLRRMALLGTRFTMEGAFYPAVFARFGIAVMPPNHADRLWVHERYVGELLRGEFREDTRLEFIALIDRIRRSDDIDGVILGGTELPLLLSMPSIAGVPALDTTALHVTAIVDALRAPQAPASTIATQ